MSQLQTPQQTTKELSVSKYVAGFMFGYGPLDEVALIHKKRPSFLAGKWNAIGGKVEAGESTIDAMVREFLEETGMATEPVNSWKHFATLAGDGYQVEFYVTLGNLSNLKSMTDEPVSWFDIHELPSSTDVDTLALIPLARRALSDHCKYHITRLSGC